MSEQPPTLPPKREQKAVTDATQPVLVPTAADRLRVAAAKARDLALSLGGRSKAAAQIIANQAERTKLTQITLPNAYRTLGRHVHGAGSLRVDFADTYGKIDALLADIAKLKATGPAVDGVKKKVMAVAKAARNKTHAHALQVKLSHEYIELGKAAFEKHRDNSGPPNVVKPILNCLALLEALAAEIADVSKSEPGAFLTPKRIAVGGLGVAALLLLLVAKMMFFGGRADDRQVTKNDVAVTRRPSDTQNAESAAAPVLAPTTANSGAEYADYYHNRGVDWAKKGELDRAIEDFNQALRQKPDYAPTYAIRGLVWIKKRDYDSAIEDFNQSLRLNPDVGNAWCAYSNRGFAWSEKGEYDRAIKDYDEALRLKPDDADTYYNRGIAWQKKLDYDKAIADYTHTLRLDANRADAYYNRGCDWGNKGEYDKAIADYDQAVRLEPDYAVAYHDRGNAWLQKEDYDKAIDDFNHALRLIADYVPTYMFRGMAWVGKENYDAAIADFNQALRLDPDVANSYGVYSIRALAWSEKGEYDRAIRDYDVAIRLKPGNPDTYVNRGDVWKRKHQYDKAIADFDQAINLNPSLVEAYTKRGNAWSDKGDYDNAIADYNQVLRLKPDYVGYYNRGVAWRTRGDYGKAIDDFSQALRFNPHFADAYQNLGLIYATCPDARYRDGANAVLNAKQACRLTNERDLKSVVALAAAYASDGQFDKAVVWQTKAIEMAPETERADLRYLLQLYESRLHRK